MTAKHTIEAIRNLQKQGWKLETCPSLLHQKAALLELPDVKNILQLMRDKNATAPITIPGCDLVYVSSTDSERQPEMCIHAFEYRRQGLPIKAYTVTTYSHPDGLCLYIVGVDEDYLVHFD